MKYDDFHKLVEANGWQYLRKCGSHVIYKKGQRTYPVPYHRGKELRKSTEMKMRREMGLK